MTGETMRQTECPDAVALRAFLLGAPAETEPAAMEGHLLACPHCQAAAANHSAPDDLCRALAQWRDLDSSTAAGVARFIEKMQATLPLPAAPAGATPPDPRTLFAPPERADELGRLGAFRIVRLLGYGGMGAVYEADEPALKRRVALKVMRPELAADPALRQRFVKEAHAIAALASDHIVPIYQVGEAATVPFYVMPLLTGETLETLFRRVPRLSIEQTLELGRQVAAGLRVAHAAGLVHRDIKPGNLWLEPTPDGAFRVKILDFGLVRDLEQQSAVGAAGAILGTPAYLAPEQAEDRAVDGRADLFSLGCVLYQAVTGRRPFRGDSLLALLRAVATDTPPPPCRLRAECPRWLSDLVLELLRKNPDRRVASAALLAERLQTRPARRTFQRAAWAACAVVLAVGVVGYVLTRPAPPGGVQPEAAAVPGERPPEPAVPPLVGGKLEMVQRIAHKGTVGAVAFSPDGQRFLTGATLARTPSVRATATGAEVLALEGHTLGIAAVAYSRDGKRLLTGSWDHTAILWDAASGRKVRTCTRHTDWVTAVAISPDGTKLLTASNGPRHVREIILWEVGREEPLRTFEASAYSVSFSADGATVVACAGTGVTRWETATGKPLPGISPRAGFFLAAACSPVGDQILTGGSERHALANLLGGTDEPVAHLWEPATRTRVRTFTGHTQRLGAVAFSPDGRQIVTASFDGSAIVWEVESGRQLGSFQADDGRFSALAIGRDGHILAGGPRTATVWRFAGK